MSLIDKEDWKSIIGLVTNAKQVVTSVQDVAQKLADYAKFTSKKKSGKLIYIPLFVFCFISKYCSVIILQILTFSKEHSGKLI